MTADNQAGASGTMSREQIAQVLYSAGARGEDLAKLVAISMRESGGKFGTIIHDSDDWGGGLFGLNTLGSNLTALGNQIRALGFNIPAGGGENVRAAILRVYATPEGSAKIAVDMLKRSGWKPWQFINSDGSRKSELWNTNIDQARQAVATADQKGLLGSGSGLGANYASLLPQSDGGAGGALPDIPDSYHPAGPMSEADIKAHASELYGWMAGYLDDPEIGPILMQAAREGWSPALLQGSISKTNWWQTTNSTARENDALKVSDPASWKKKVDDKTVELMQMLRAQGITVDNAQLRELAENAVRLGWNDVQTNSGLAGMLAHNPTLATSAIADKLRATADDYGIKLDDPTLQYFASGIITGDQSEQDFMTRMKTMAIGAFPTLTKAIQGGMTVKQYAAPYLQVAVDTLGVNPADIDLTQGKWRAAIDSMDPDGQRRALSLDEWTKKLKKDTSYGWDKTDSARAEAFDFQDNLGKMFGKAA